MNSNEKLLEVNDLRVEFRLREGVAHAINGVSFDLYARETLAILGESGSGKSVTAQAIMGILDSPPGFVTGGEAKFRGVDLFTQSENERRKVRGPGISMIFQDALSSLNPVFPVGWQIGEMFRQHRGMNRSDAEAKAIELMERVHIPAAKERVRAYPHQFSGGMRQRIMIAMAIALDPMVLIADEPTTAIDVTTQAQILQLMRDLQEDLGMAIMFITHDLGVIAEMADYVVVMYAGRIIEQGTVREIFHHPKHPYTVGLMKSKPGGEMVGDRLYSIRGQVPNPINMPDHCYFCNRCEQAMPICHEYYPGITPFNEDHSASCFLYSDVILHEEDVLESLR